MAISAQDIKLLRDRTGAPIGDCKKALDECGDVESAVEHLRKQGLAKAAKKAGRAARDGRIALAVSEDAKRGAIVEINCETDFVARTPDFERLCDTVTGVLLNAEETPASAEAFLALAAPGGTVASLITDAVAKIGENIQLGRFARLSPEGPGRVGSYLHFNARVGVLVQFACASDAVADGLADLGKQLSMHVTMAAPQFVSADQIPAETLERERAVLLDVTKQEKPDAPEQAVEKIVEGRLRKFKEDACLLDQPWIHDEKGKTPVSEVLAKAAKDLGGDVRVAAFARVSLDEAASAAE